LLRQMIFAARVFPAATLAAPCGVVPTCQASDGNGRVPVVSYVSNGAGAMGPGP
jgi:hypothetical protein